jgi:hypothetical protein
LIIFFRYGYRPLPRSIDQENFGFYYKLMDDVTKEIADKWFKLDANTSCYVLEDLKGNKDDDKVFWEIDYPILLNSLDGMSFDENFYPLCPTRPHLTQLHPNLQV